MIPTATYRLQFRNGMTFDRAAALVPYLKNLGISHLYASPIFTATKASTHGYDVTDANEIEPSIGGREGFERLVAELKAQGLGLIIDIVPNHMASSLENAWWRDVLEYGKESRYARHFDIDWSRRLTLPFLGDTFDAVLENGEIAIKPDPATGKPAFAYYDNYYPLAPATWQGREAEILALTDKAAIADLHERQPWKLMSWRDAARSLSYRRFFEVTGLVGMRVEDKTVFDDTHRLILELVRTGRLTVYVSIISTALPIRKPILRVYVRKWGRRAISPWKKFSLKASNFLMTGRFPAPQAMNLSPRWRRCWLTMSR